MNPRKKTTLVFPKTLHKRAKIRAIKVDTDLSGVVDAALRAYLKKPCPCEQCSKRRAARSRP